MIFYRIKQMLIRLFAPWVENRALRQQVDHLQKCLMEPDYLEAKIEGVKGAYSANVQMQHWAIKLLAWSFMDTLEKFPEAENFLTVDVMSPIGIISVTLQRPGSQKSPAQSLSELRAELETYKNLKDIITPATEQGVV